MARRFPVTMHLARGALGFAALWAGLRFASHAPGYSIALVIVGLLLLRGCPMCWAAMLLERLTGNRDAASGCADGSCERDEHRSPPHAR